MFCLREIVPAKAFFLFIVFVLLILGLSRNTYAQGGITCHCFKDRDYNPADSFAADDYILATSFNSLLARYFAISKGQIIMLKMNQKVQQDDLLIGLKLARASGENANKLIGLRRAGKTWQEIIEGLKPQDKVGSDPLLEMIRAGISANQAGSSIADEIIGRFYTVPAEVINELRQAGLNEKEMALLFILAHAKDQKPEILLKQRIEENKSWSEIAHNLGIEPAAAGKLILAYPAKRISEKK